MADIEYRDYENRGAAGGTPTKLLVDMGDGTYAERVVLASATGGATPVQPTSDTPEGYIHLDSTALATAVGLTVPVGSRFAIIQNNGTEDVRWRDDGTAPDATTGMVLANGEAFTYYGDLDAIQFIREADGAILDISVYS